MWDVSIPKLYKNLQTWFGYFLVSHSNSEHYQSKQLSRYYQGMWDKEAYQEPNSTSNIGWKFWSFYWISDPPWLCQTRVQECLPLDVYQMTSSSGPNTFGNQAAVWLWGTEDCPPRSCRWILVHHRSALYKLSRNFRSALPIPIEVPQHFKVPGGSVVIAFNPEKVVHFHKVCIYNINIIQRYCIFI